MSSLTKSRVVIILAALAFGGMLAASLWQRFTHPSLVVHHFTRPLAAEDGNFNDAIGALMEAAAKNSADTATLKALVEGLMGRGQWPAAEHFAQRLLALDQPGQEDPQTLFLLALINHNQGRHAQAAELLEKSLARRDDPSARYSLGILYVHFLDRPEDGVVQYQKALEDPAISPLLAQTVREEMARMRPQAPVEPAAEGMRAAPEEAPANASTPGG